MRFPEDAKWIYVFSPGFFSGPDKSFNSDFRSESQGLLDAFLLLGSKAMAEIDQIAAAKTSLEFLVQENQQMLNRFQELSRKFGEIGKMASPSRQNHFRKLEETGAFLPNEIDIRHFSQTSKQSLTPFQFVQSARRRLHNTCFLAEKFMATSTFEEGPQLRDVLLGFTNDNFHSTDHQAVNDYKNMVERVQNSDLFRKYLQARKLSTNKIPTSKPWRIF